MRARFLLLVAVFGLLPAPAGAGARIRLSGAAMGTTYAVDVPTLPGAVDAERLRADVEQILATIDRQMSTYRPDSEISRFNASRSTEWTELSADTRDAIAATLEVSRRTRGALDVTVAPLVELWGFGAEDRPRRRPPPEELRAALERVGYRKLDVRDEPPAARKRRPDLQVDLSAIGNGFGVDRIAEHLDHLGIRDYLVEIGGELRGRGRNARGDAWTVAVEQPGGAADAALAVVRLDGAAIATSGPYRTYFDEDGVRYGHVIDPRTGMPVRHALTLVSVIDDRATRADALATALLVLGPDEGWRLAQERKIAALFVIDDGAGLRQRRTAGFERRQLDRGDES